MKNKLAISGAVLAVFAALGMFLTVSGTELFHLQYRIAMTIASMSFIVMLMILGVFISRHSGRLGFVFLGTVIFKMFGVGYLAVFQEDFKTNIIPYFILFWIFLAMEAAALIFLLRKQDINHKT